MKKVLIVAVCLALVLTLAFTLGALGKKPEKPPGKPIYELTFAGDVYGTVEQCGAQGRFISSSNIDRPTLTLSETFKTLSEDYSGEHDGLYLDLSEQKGEITMQFFFIDPATGEKIQLNVYRGYVDPEYGDSEWLSTNFKIIFDGAEAKITPTKGKKFPPLWYYRHMDITIHCQGK